MKKKALITCRRQEEKMGRVYLLGAGASRELTFNLTTMDSAPKTRKTSKFCRDGPLSSGYFYDAHNFAQSIKGRLPIAASLNIGDNLSQYLCEYYNATFGRPISKGDILNNKATSRKINIESLYLHIEKEIAGLEKKGKKSQSQDFHMNDPLVRICLIRHELLTYIHRSLSLICYYCFSIYHKILASYIVNYGGNVISFNWDTLMDEEMQCTGKWNYRDGYGVKFKDIIYKSGKKQDTSLQDKSNNIVFKPHGSINWYKKVNGENGLCLFIPVERNRRGGTLDILGASEYDKSRNQYYFTSVIPPGIKRKAFPDVWLQMKEVLEKADEIIAIGFSFNDNDGHVKEEFEGINFGKDLKISLIDPNANRILSMYKDVFKTNNIVNTHSTLGNYCQWIVKQERMEELEILLQ